LNHIWGYYNTTEVVDYKIIDTSRASDDVRYTVIVKYSNGEKLAIKLTNNSFTTKERIEGWNNLIKVYRGAGIYCPRIVKTITGEVSKRVEVEEKEFIMYCEEYKKYSSLEEVSETANIEQIYNALYESIGIIASKSIDVVPWHTAYCIYDKFCAEDTYDENYDNALNFYKLAKKKLIQYEEKVEEIWCLYVSIREKFEVIYHKLPVAVFQGDTNESNILINDKYDFFGLIDFNLSGTEKVLNYFLCEAICSPNDKKDLSLLMSEEYLNQCDTATIYKISLMCKHYKFSKIEMESFTTLYNLVVPFRWPTFCLFKWAINNDMSECYENILDWIYYQLTRTFELNI